MTKKIETALIVLIYVLGTYLNWELAYIGCAFNFGPKGAYECAVAGVGKLTLFCLLIFGVPTYHFGLKGGLKMGIAFLCSGFIWLILWLLASEVFDPDRKMVVGLGWAVAVPIIVLYLFSYRSEWKKRKSRSF